MPNSIGTGTDRSLIQIKNRCPQFDFWKIRYLDIPWEQRLFSAYNEIENEIHFLDNYKIYTNKFTTSKQELCQIRMSKNDHEAESIIVVYWWYTEYRIFIVYDGR